MQPLSLNSEGKHQIISLIFELNFEFKGNNTKNILCAFHPKAPPSFAPGDQMHEQPPLHRILGMRLRRFARTGMAGTCHCACVWLLCQCCQAAGPRGRQCLPSAELRHAAGQGGRAGGEHLESSSLLKQEMNSRSVLQGAGGQGTQHCCYTAGMLVRAVKGEHF